jgi:hypothetical protein
MQDADEAEVGLLRTLRLFAEIDDDLRALSEKVDSVIAIDDIVFACLETGCSDHIALTPSEHEAVREARFAVRPGHVQPRGRPAVGGHDGSMVVDKRSASVDS